MTSDNLSFHSQTVRLDSLNVTQLVAIFGDGKMRDASECSQRFRAFLRSAPLIRLGDYVQTCLDPGFTESGFVLQDLVNELGRRLDFDVENGLYQGRSNSIGFDGLWKLEGGANIIIEVKTTDAYRMNLDTIVEYRNRLVTDGKAKSESSCLIVVGRQDTGDLEAQVRGSRHAWSIRIISADALLRLVQLKENADEKTAAKTRELLLPFEFTRLDRIIDLAFTAASEASEGIAEDVADVTTTPEELNSDIIEQRLSVSQDHTPGDEQERLRLSVSSALASEFDRELVKKSRAAYWSLDRHTRAIISLSKIYPGGWYWYGYRPAWDNYLSEGTVGIFALACVGIDDFFALPFDFIHSIVDDLNISIMPDNGEIAHWHIHLQETNGDMRLKLHKVDEFISVERFRRKLASLSTTDANS